MVFCAALVPQVAAMSLRGVAREEGRSWQSNRDTNMRMRTNNANA